MGGHHVVRSYTIGEGELRALPPRLTPLSPASRPQMWLDGEESLEYEGELRCAPNVTVGGFSAGKLVVSDFIVLAASPAHELAAEFEELSHAHTVRIVTDTCRDIPAQ